MPARPPVRSRGILACAVIAAICGALLGGTNWLTQDRIAANRTERQWHQITAITGRPPASGAPVWRNDELELAGDIRVLRRRSRGYAGLVSVLVGTAGGRITGVAVAAHAETAGLGDYFDHDGGAWLDTFRGQRPGELAVDTVSGATITGRAIIRAVRSAGAAGAGEVRP